jgi:3-hydroxyacyl-CoA dehydrogenase
VVYGDDKLARFAWKALANNLIYATNRIPEISDTVVDIDNAMRWGFNFELGPFETWDAIGLKESVEKMARDGFEVPEKIRTMIAAGRSAFYRTDNGAVSYYDFAAEGYRERDVSPNIISLKALKGAGKVIRDIPSATLVDLGDGVACLEFHTKMNALNAEILDFMAQALDHVDANGAGLVIGNQAGGMPGAFSAGADLKGILGAVQEKRFDDIEKMVHDLQMVLQRARYAPFPVVAAPFGLTLGGGCEVCLAVDRIVGHAELYMGLVEIGVGLLPPAEGA